MDAEPDGQPDASALGDDANLFFPGIAYPPGDEDGVVFNSLLVKGQTASITVTASAAGGLLNAWIDYNQDGAWGAAEKIFTDQALTVGSNPLNITVPGGASLGKTYARFRFSTLAGLSPKGMAPDGEVEDYKVWIEETEEPHKMHWPQYPDPNGWDVRASDGSWDGKEKILADDFLCTSNGPITHITFWGSFEWDAYNPNYDYGGITNFHLSFHTDIPVDPPEILYSRPGQLLWERDVNPENPSATWTVTITPEEPSLQGWYDPNHPEEWEAENHSQYFRYDIYIPETEAFIQTNNTIYWLDIAAKLGESEAMWGWKTSRSPHFNDDAVWADRDDIVWQELLDPIYSNSLDLAFIIDGGEEEEPPDELDWGDAPDQPYPTLNASMGANHTIVAGMFLGAGVDSEPDGQPNAAATGDDANINGLGGIAFPPGDEDGVVFTQLVPGLPATITVTASLAGNLDAWIDYNADGIWSASEKLTGATIALNPGANNINITVPTGTAPVLTTYARFRYSTAGGLSPAGPAADGEVEDYKVSIDDPTDWGDAPDPAYPTLSGSMGANHLIGGPFLGSSVDPELDGQPTALADGDDLDLQGDDEDGVTLLTQIIPGAVARINVGLGGAAGAPLDAWIDYNVDGIWGPGEKIFNSVVLGAGGNVLFFPVPGGATPSTNTFARFRVSSAGGLTPAGQAQDGEVEDYMFHIGEAQPLDWGDAPVSYQTLAINNGAHHVAVGGFLGTTRDAEADGQPNATATGDDIVGLPDEDGVAFVSKIQAGGYARINVVATAPGMLDAWIDFQKDGTWVQAVDRIFTSQPLTAGMNKLAFPVPLVATNIASQSTFARFRFSSGGVPAPTGLALNGEVEDYEVDIFETEYLGVDRGDAPDPTYPTLTNSVGASHTIIPGYVLGASIDSESEGQQSSNAQGDDIANIDDEDGVIFAGTIVAGSNVTINVVAGVSTPAYLDGWIDFDKNGSWLDSGEQVFASQSVSPGLNSLPITIPQPTALGPTFARFRLSSTGGLSPTGAAGDGEVEDYMVDLYQPQTSTNIVITNLFFKVSNTVAQVEWNAESNITYQVQSSTNLMTNVWTDVGGWLLGPVNWQTNSTSPDEQFYRVTAPWTE
ncbi:MAG: hypothetical protein K9M45_04930 [Kiritimatiellales bacterium]|nr:hypothetical protein [Kiritimatiellales bacterium]